MVPMSVQLCAAWPGASPTIEAARRHERSGAITSFRTETI